ncbi:SPFH domain-containing protein [Uliginosibacterium sp. H1]|uniref:SPFH domain-containing protein n=1 Tax=Uliginosibacterium sp. H1 TaxID=3114757 RepID=UPI002E19DDD4|nr:SPFH domain-containing protein [Uliginosibacterium sp. H1]
MHNRGKLLGFVVLLGLGLALLIGTAGTIGTGNVGIRQTLGIISQDEVTPGVYLKWPLISTVREFTAKEVVIDLQDLTPKAKDNLSLRDMDISIYYKADQGQIAELQSKYSGQSQYDGETKQWLPAFGLLHRVVRNAAYEEVAKVDSLVMHTRRDAIAGAIRDNVQAELEKNDPKVFQVTRVVIRSVATDPSIEESIRNAVANQKKLEAMTIQTEIAKKESEIRVTEAEGISRANKIIADSLTREYLQHEANQALLKFAEKGNTNTVVVPANMSVAPLLNIPSKQ